MHVLDYTTRRQFSLRWAILCSLLAYPLHSAEPAPPQQVAEQTLTDSKALASLQTPGKIVFQDDFESKGADAK